MRLGLDCFLEREYKKLIGKRIGLVTNMTGVNKRLTPGIDLFHSHPDIHLTALYGPEHGIRGDAKEGEWVDSKTDPYTGIPVYSLYGHSKKPSYEMMKDVDVIVFDLQDIGSRYYTFIYTMAYMMEACAAYGIAFVVLDRPNPISGSVMEGNLVEADVRSFVGLYPIPNRHGMTIGELAQFFNEQFNIQCKLTVIQMEGWRRQMYYDETNLFWVAPSPNTTSLDMAILYPGTCLLEGTNVSEGRGTTKPFEYVGASFIDGYRLSKTLNEKKLPGVIARPLSFVPTYQKYKDEVCGGVQLHVEHYNQIHSLEIGLVLLETLAAMYPNDFQFVCDAKGSYFFDLLAGTKRLREMILKGETGTFLQECANALSRFSELREPYLLYR